MVFLLDRPYKTWLWLEQEATTAGIEIFKSEEFSTNVLLTYQRIRTYIDMSIVRIITL